MHGLTAHQRSARQCCATCGQRLPPKRVGGLTIRLNGLVTYRGKAVALRPTEIDTLEALARNFGHSVHQEVLLARVYGAGADVGLRTIEVHLSNIRKRIAPLGLLIRNERGVGWALERAD